MNETLDKMYLEWSQFTGARNAREIAMLDALRKADEAINPTDRPDISLHTWNERLKGATAVIRAAIAKAEGQ